MDGEWRRKPIGECNPLPPEDWVQTVAPSVEIENLYRKNAARLRRFFTRRAPRDEAPDLVHETFRKFLSSARAPIDITRPDAYLSRVATNLLRDRTKIAIRRSENAHDDIESVPLAGPDPHRQLEARDMLARASTAIDRLKPKRREIFLLHRIDGLEYAEIAERMGMSVKTIEWHIGQALVELKRMVGRP
jgi:RNA polymerase sigma factor (sigma-70 family)